MFVIHITYKKPLSLIDEHLQAHREFLETGYQRNYFIASGPKTPRTGGIILSQVSDRKKIETFLKNDPYVVHDLADYEFIEFTPVKYHKDFENFIAKSS